jgi:hypothetical protein
MTALNGSTSIDGTPISDADRVRIDAEEQLHAQQQRAAVRVVAGASLDAEDCRVLLSMLGLTGETVQAARALTASKASVAATSAAGTRSGKRTAA